MDRATQYLEEKISSMDKNTKQFENAMKREPRANALGETAEQALERLKAKHRKPVPKTAQDEAAAVLANINGPINSDGS